MTRITFYLVVALSLVFLAMTVVETWMYQTCEMAVAEQKDIQIHLSNAQRLHVGLQEMLRRMAIESQHDPALLDMLKKNRIKVNVINPGDTPATTPTSSAPAAPKTPSASQP